MHKPTCPLTSANSPKSCPNRLTKLSQVRFHRSDFLSVPSTAEWKRSSPLTRGGLIGGERQRIRVGLIPAYAGRTPRSTGRIDRWWAHPRLRGADAGSIPVVGSKVGSSPLTRGGQALSLVGITALGLIPAYAGRTACTAARIAAARAHPRLRGADEVIFTPVLRLRGSSPLTRGGLGIEHWIKSVEGLIPAYAGRTRYRALD